MLSLLATLLGGLSGLLPNILKFFEKKQEFAHELDLKRLEMEAAKQGVELTLKVEEAKADAAEGPDLRRHDLGLDGGPFINGLRASIRPVVTYTFFFFFLLVKGVILYQIIHNANVSPLDAFRAIWDTDTSAIFSAVMAFHFGSRTLEKQYARGR